ncbi:cell division protein FtsQ/DivIB [Pedobacter cryotolerans]|uniref:Cell division protein FtsQ n=1 Tax=Pedobacter cryotolerans TaxID=2571270 RepID=A0A4U1BYT2_9SPHI|nr:cell division protein FtsQ [Pedobacter cryotolerans]TKB98263.1 cell division protein FtsQ [Pedobacter cryotolerans]
MLKRINWKAIFKGFAWLISLAGMVVLMSFISIKKHEVKCTKVEILIPGADNFIEREEIDAILKANEGELVGRNLEAINIHEIEKTIKANPYIAYVKVFNEMNGVIHIEIKQRQPVLRIINAGGQDYYIDSEGLKMPMSPNFTANVLVATGNILEGFSGRVDTLLTPLAKDLYKTALFSKRDTLWDAQFEQIFVNEKSDIELIPRVGNQRIILGNADSLATKMNNLLVFYKQAMPKVGWNAYKTINLKYYNQIVAERYDSLAVKEAIAAAIVDSTTIKRKATDSVIRDVIKDEIKKAVAEAASEQPTAKKATVTAKPATDKSAIKTSETNAAKTVTDKGKTKPVTTTKEKTDTKKNK